MADHRAVAALVSFALLLCTGRARAQSSQGRASALFKEARTLVDAGNYAEACPKLEESQRLDPGVGTQFNLADCYEHTRRPSTANRLYREVAAAAHAAGKTEREKAAQQRMDLLASALPRLRVTVADHGAVEVRVDGRLVDANERSEPIALDPGPHVVAVTAPDRQPALLTVSVGDRGVFECRVPPLATRERERAAVAPVSAWPWQRTASVATLAAGLGGAGVGTAFGLVARGKHSEVRELCPGYPTCPSSSLALARSIDSEGRSAATIATIAFVAGGAALGASLSFFLLTPRPAANASGRLQLGVSLGGATVEGTW